MMSSLIASSFVPDEKIQRLRQYDRHFFEKDGGESRLLEQI